MIGHTAPIRTTLGKLSSLITSGSRGWAEYYAETGALFLRMTNLPKEGIKLLLRNNKYVSLPSSSSERKRTSVQQNDILISITAELGKIGFVESDPGEAYVNQHVALVRITSSKAYPKFVAYYLTETRQRNLWQRLNDAGAKAGLNLQTINTYPVTLPPLEQQTAIADLLSTWDITIEKYERLIEAKRLRHVALSNKLLSRRYIDVPLKKFLTLVVRDVAKPDKPYWALGIRSHGKGTFRRFIEYPEAVAMDTLYRVQHNDIILNITFAWEGAIALVKETDEDCLVSHRFPTFEVNTNKALPDYLRHVIVQKQFIRDLGLISPGGAGRNRVLNKKDFLNLKISLPGIKEQERIGNVLNTSIKEISLLEAQLELLKKQKRGLMQKLLTGQWRVKIDEEVE